MNDKQAHPRRPGAGTLYPVRPVVLTLILALVAGPALALPQETPQQPAMQAQADVPEDTRPPLELSLHEAIEMALRHNLQVQIQAFTPDAREEQIMASRARFDPVATFNVPSGYSRSVSQAPSQLTGAQVLTRETVSGGFSFNHLLEYGTNYTINWTSSRTETNSTFSRFNPQYSAGLTLNVTQPLLRNFGKEVQRQQIIQAQNSYEQSIEQFRQQVQNIVFQVIQAYWNLVTAEENLEVQQLSLDLAQQQLDRNRVQVEIGTLAPIETIQAEQQVASARLALTRSEVTIRDREDDLKRLINVEAASPLGWDVNVVPTSEPPTEVPPVDLEAAIETAMDNDPQLRQQRIGLDTQQLNVDVARNQLLPQLNLTGNVNLTGEGGPLIISSGFGSEQVLEIIPGGYGDALSNLFSGDFRNWQVGLQLQFPINNWAARAQHAQAIISERTTLTQIADREQALRVEVMQAARAVQSGVQQVAQARTATELARRSLDAEQRKFAVGSSTNFQVLEFQRQLSNAQIQELQAITALATAIAQLEQAKGTLLESLGFDIRMAGVPDASR